MARRDVFVQSIHSGLPVEGASIEVIGAQWPGGLAATTDGAGRAHLAKFARTETGKSPADDRGAEGRRLLLHAALQRRAAQLGYVALRYWRRGERESVRSNFRVTCLPDRGIYRPGETAISL